MKLKRRGFLGSFNRFRLILTLLLLVVLPAAALIYVNYRQLRNLERDKLLEAAIYRDFQERLALTEKRMNKKIYLMAEEIRDVFPSPDMDQTERGKKFEEILKKTPWVSHVMLFDEKDFVMQMQPEQIHNTAFRREYERMSESFRRYFGLDGKILVQSLHKKTRPFSFYGSLTRQPGGDAYLSTVLFTIPGLPKDRMSVGGFTFDPGYMKKSFLPEMLEESVKQKSDDDGGNKLALMIYPVEGEGGMEMKPFVASTGWTEGKPEVSRKLDDVFRGMAMGIKFQGTSVAELGKTWVHRSLIILGCLSLLIVGGLVLTRHIVNKEMALARLKSDFVSNVSHELRTPLALIRLYAETLELGRITTSDKKQQYYRIIRKESERLSALINNILDFSRIEAGRKEYEFRETDIAELIRNTLDSYRYQIEQQGFAFEENIDMDLPAVYVDREAIARALVNLMNNALKYSCEQKFLGVKLYRDNGTVKLEVADRGIGIARRDQAKIFEKFYRAGDPLVHNTKGSGLGLSLVRHITQAHGGDITVESTPGKGSKFILSIPLGSESQQAIGS
jgi:signal transduction histidine kinase